MRDLRIFRIFEGSNEILRLMIALQSMQVLGKILKENKGMAVKAKVSETLGMSLSGNASGNLASKTDSSLQGATPTMIEPPSTPAFFPSALVA